MIRGLALLILSTLTVLSVRAEENLSDPLFSSSFAGGTAPCGVYASGWETVPSWQLEQGVGSLLYTYSRPLEQVSPSVLKEGVVVVFARGYDFEGVSKAEEKPLGLPFYMALASENAPYPSAWSYTPSEQKVTIGLSMPEALKTGFEQGRSEIQLRFFVLTPEFLRGHKLNPMMARKMSYTQLVGLLNTEP